MGSVYLGRHTKLNRKVAIKILTPQVSEDKTYIARFYREARASCQLNHPNIVQGLDAGEANGFHYFIMEFVEGESLQDRLEREGKLPEPDVIGVGIGIASALEHAAASAIVHRDLKPANVLLDQGGQVKLVDLGLAKQVGGGSDIQKLTRAGVILGSPYYLAPEQAAEQGVDHRSDLYSLGATLFHLATGAVPFDGEDPIEILEKVLHSSPPDPKVRNPELSDALSWVIGKLLSKQRDDRFQTAKELREALEEPKATGTVKAMPAPKRGGLFGFIRGLFGG